MKRRGLLSNFAHFGVSSMVGSVLALLATVHLARALGVAVFGEFSVARTIVDYITLISSAGLTLAAARRIASSRSAEDRHHVVHAVTILRACIGIGGGLVLLLVALFADTPALRQMAAILSLGAMFSALSLDWVYSAMENVALPSFVKLVGRCLYAAVIVFGVHAAEDAWIAAAALVLENLVVFVALHARSPVRPSLRASLRPLREAGGGRSLAVSLAKEAWPLAAGQLARQMKTNADTIILALMTTATAVGLYSAAYRLVMFVNMLAGLYATVLLPRIARSRTEGSGWLGEIVSSVRLTVVGAVGVGVFGALVSRDVMLRLFGPEYAGSADIVPALVAASGFVVVSMVLGNIAVALDVGRLWVRTTVAAAALNVVGNLALIPVLGVWGPVSMTLLTEAGLCLALAAALWSRGIGEALSGPWLSRLALACGSGALACGAALYLSAPMLVSAAIGLGAYLAALAGLSVITRRDVTRLAGMPA